MENKEIKVIQEAEKRVVEKLVSIINDMGDLEKEETLLTLMQENDSWSGYFSENVPFFMDSLNDMLGSCDFLENYDKINHQKFNSNDEYFVCDIYGIFSLSQDELLEYLTDFTDDIAQATLDNWENLYADNVNDEIKELLNGYYEALENNEVENYAK